MCNREQVVINGCSGKCCEAFTLPFSLADFRKNSQTIEEGNDYFIDDNGYTRGVITDPTRDFVIDMLIDLGESNEDPQHEAGHLEKRWGGYSDKEVFKASQGSVFRKDGKLTVRVFTCRHFDTENRVCTVYDQRPRMCRNFGNTCGYSGCGFKEKSCGVPASVIAEMSE